VAVYRHVDDLIGSTPVVEVSELSANPGVRIFVKLEGVNPAGSVKDRIARAMLDAAEADGSLRPGQTIVEPSSGNTGIALAMLARRRGYPVVIVMPENVSAERRHLLEIFGAQVVETPAAEGSNGAVRRAEVLAMDNPGWCFLYQYSNEANPRAHYETTGPELWADLPDMTHFVAGLGTSGTLMGVGTYLRERNPDIEIWAVEPPVGEMVDGLRNLDEGYVPPIFDKWGGADLLDRKLIIRPRESILAVRRLVAECGLLTGLSAGAALAAALRISERVDRATIALVAADGAWKYLSTGAWTDPIDEVVERAADTVLF